MGGAGTAVKLASHFHMARHLVEAGEDGLDHASLCKEAQALGTRKQLQPGFLFHPGRQWMLRGTLSMRYTVAWLKALDEYQRASQNVRFKTEMWDSNPRQCRRCSLAASTFGPQ